MLPPGLKLVDTISLELLLLQGSVNDLCCPILFDHLLRFGLVQHHCFDKLIAAIVTMLQIYIFDSVDPHQLTLRFDRTVTAPRQT